MPTCIIIEDDRLASLSLVNAIEQHFSNDLQLLGTAETFAKGIELISNKTPDIVFLDIELPDEIGFNIYNYFQPMPFEVVFTTSNQDYALRAIKNPCIDYLLKPIQVGDIRTTIIKYNNSQNERLAQQQLRHSLEHLLMGRPFSQKITFPIVDGFQILHINDIIYCQASENYTYVHTIHNLKFLVTKTLKAIEELLPTESFYRIHKSTLVNINYVKSFTKRDGNCTLTLETGQRLEVAARRQDDFSALFLRKNTVVANNVEVLSN